MKKSHKREIFMARVIFAIFLVVVALIVALAVLLVSSHLKKDKPQKENPKTSEQTSDNNTEPNTAFEPGEDGITPDTTEPETDVPEQTNSRWTTTSVNFRTEANTSCDVIATLAEGTEVEWQSEENGWAAVTYDGKSGYISTEYLTDVDPKGDQDTPDDQEADNQASNKTGGYEDASQVAIVIDPGHQTNGDSTREANGPGSSTMKARVTGGATGVASGVPEYQLNLDISLLLKKELENRGYTVYLTRSTNDVNISNKERAEYATSVGADISVRIHANSSEDKNIKGALTLSPSSDNEYVANLAEDSMRLSECILQAYCKSTGLEYKGCTTSDVMTGINWSTVPVTILEMGFLSNEEDDLQMQDSTFRIKMVQGIANGIDDYYGF